MDIIIEVSNVNSGFQPEHTSLSFLMKKVRELYNQAIAPEKLDGRVRAIFEETKSFEFIPEFGYYLPTEPVQVLIYCKHVSGGMLPPKIVNFSTEESQIAWYADIFLANTNNHNLNLPANIKIGLSGRPDSSR